MEDLFDGIDLGDGHHVDDHQLAGGRAAGDVRGGGRRQGDAQGRAGRHPAERHPQGVHRAEGVDLPARARRCGWSRDIMAFCAAEMPRWHPISISGYHIREAGSTAVQELAFTLADGFAYVEAAIEGGTGRRRVRPAALLLLQRPHRLLRGDRQVPRGAAHLGAVAARPLRRQRSPSMTLRFHTQTAGVSLTAQQPENNVVRTAIEALAGGAGRDPVPAHQLDGRDAGAAHREGGSRSRCAPSRSSPTRPASPTWSTRWAARGSSRS